MRVQHTNEFKQLVLQRLLSDPACGTRGLARELGVAKSTIWSWRVELTKVIGTMNLPPTSLSPSLMSPRAARSAQEKLTVVLTASTLQGEPLGAYLRTQGVVDAELAQWRAEMLHGLEQPGVALAVREAPPSRRDARRIAKLEKALRSTQALLELKKKADAMWGIVPAPCVEELRLETELAAHELPTTREPALANPIPHALTPATLTTSPSRPAPPLPTVASSSLGPQG